jgi:hypothetical protein
MNVFHIFFISCARKFRYLNIIFRHGKKYTYRQKPCQTQASRIIREAKKR